MMEKENISILELMSRPEKINFAFQPIFESIIVFRLLPMSDAAAFDQKQNNYDFRQSFFSFISSCLNRFYIRLRIPRQGHAFSCDQTNCHYIIYGKRAGNDFRAV